MSLADFVEDTQAKSKAYYAREENVSVSSTMIQALFYESQGKNIRLCLHNGSEDTFHQMLIVEYRGKSFPAHRHPTKSEGYHLIEGEMELLLYSQLGNVLQTIPLNKDNPIARVGPNTFHALQVVSPYAIYLESKPGPFVRESDKVMAAWLKS